MFLAVKCIIWILASASFVKAAVVRVGVFDQDERQKYPLSSVSSKDLRNHYQILLVDGPISEVDYEDSAQFLRKSEENEPKVISNLEWKKLRRYINRQLRVPQRYWKRIVRNLNKVVKLRSADADGDPIRRMSSSNFDDVDIDFLADKDDYFLARDILMNRCKNLQFLRNLDVIGYVTDYDE